MDIKTAVQLAEHYVSDLFSAQLYSQPNLEEVEFDPDSKIWNVTIGFLRIAEQPKAQEMAGALGLGTPTDTGQKHAALAQALLGAPPFVMPRRAYKIVRVSDPDGSLLSVKDRI